MRKALEKLTVLLLLVVVTACKPLPTPTSTPESTRTPHKSPTPPIVATLTPSGTPLIAVTVRPSPTATARHGMPTLTPSATSATRYTDTPEPEATNKWHKPTRTPRPAKTPKPTKTATPIGQPTLTNTPTRTPTTVTNTPTPTSTPTKTATPTPTPTQIISPLATPTQANSPLPTPTQSNSPLPTPTQATSPLATPTQVVSSYLWTGDAEEGNLNDWYNGGGIYTSGTNTYGVSTEQKHDGIYSLKATTWFNSTQTSGVRAFRWDESRSQRGAYYSVWVYFPEQYALTHSTSNGQFWNLFQFKSRSVDGRNDPVWAFYGENDGTGKMKIYAGWGWGGTNISGPYHISNISGKSYHQSISTVPVGQWVNFEAYLYQSKDFDGQVAFWQDGIQLFNFTSIRTSFDNPNYNSWHANNEWAVNNYNDGTSPSPSVLYIDDAAISLSRIWAGNK